MNDTIRTHDIRCSHIDSSVQNNAAINNCNCHIKSSKRRSACERHNLFCEHNSVNCVVEKNRRKCLCISKKSVQCSFRERCKCIIGRSEHCELAFTRKSVYKPSCCRCLYQRRELRICSSSLRNGEKCITRLFSTFHDCFFTLRHAVMGRHVIHRLRAHKAFAACLTRIPTAVRRACHNTVVFTLRFTGCARFGSVNYCWFCFFVRSATHGQNGYRGYQSSNLDQMMFHSSLILYSKSHMSLSRNTLWALRLYSTPIRECPARLINIYDSEEQGVEAEPVHFEKLLRIFFRNVQIRIGCPQAVKTSVIGTEI